MWRTEGIEVAPVGSGEERAFHALYRGHPGVGILYRTSRAVLEAAAAGASDRIFLLAYDRRPGRPVGALALLPERGRRMTSFFPIARGDGDRAGIYRALGVAASALASSRGCRRLECEFSDTRAARRLEPGVAAMGLAAVTDRLILTRDRERGDGAARESGFAAAADWGVLAGPMSAMYQSSGDPGLRTMDACDDLALLAPDPGDATRAAFTFTAGGATVALAILEVRAGAGAVLFIGVVPGAQGRGFGRTMLRCCLGELAARGARRVGLAVSAENARALALYRAFGFRERARARLYRAEVA